MRKNVTLRKRSDERGTTWRLIGPLGEDVAPFAAFADSLFGHPFNTRSTYCQHVAEFIDYVYEAIAALHAAQPDQGEARSAGVPSKLDLERIVTSYKDYLVLGSQSNREVAQLVARTMPRKQCKGSSATAKITAVNQFLKLSEAVRRELLELATAGLIARKVDTAPLAFAVGTRREASAAAKHALNQTNAISGSIAGGPKELPRALLEAGYTEQEFDLSRAIPFDKIEPFIFALPTHRDKAYHAFLAASGLRSSEGSQVLWDDIDINGQRVLAINPASRLSHPSYLALTPEQRERLAWKGRIGSETFLIEPFVSIFFEELVKYLKFEYVPHGRDDFVFQDITTRGRGKPFFLCSTSSRLQPFKSAADKVGLGPLVVGPHSFRHAYAIYLLNYFPRSDGGYGLPIGQVRQILGHESIKNTEKYARHDAEMLEIELQYANKMVYSGNSPRALIDLKIDAVRSQLAKLEAAKSAMREA